MKKNDSNQNPIEKDVWKGAAVGAILAGGVAKALTHDGKRAKGRFQRFLSARKWFVCTVIFLIVCVLATTFLLVGQFDQYFYRKAHDVEIDLLSEPGFNMDDGSGNLMFSTESEQKMFHASYTNADGSDFTVVSAKGDTVIAPGTQGEYTFRLNNPDDVEVLYSVTLDGLFSVEDTEHLIPILVRMKGRDGGYLIGSDQDWAYISELKAISDAGTLKGKTSRYYTIEWTWPYESGNDALDTMLGNGELSIDGAPLLKPEEDLDFILQIETNAMLPVEDRAPFTIFFERTLPILLIITIVLLLGALAAVVRYRYVDKKSKQ